MQYSIQYLRAIAATMVVAFHCFYSVDFMRPMAAPFLWMRSGVDIFFVISGYVMVASTRGRDISPAAFLKRRLARIAPLYWLATAIACLSLFPGEWQFKIGSFLFLPVTNPANGMIEPIIQPGWTLNYEMFFYVLFAATLAIPAQWRILTMAATLGLIVAAGTAVGATGIGGFYSSSIIIEFLMGMILARYKVPAHWIMAPLGFAALALLSEYSGPRAIILGLPALAVVAGSIAMESRIPKWQWFRLLGDASYAVYLFHMTVLAMLIATVPWFATGTYWLLPVTAILATTIGVVIHLMLEKPMLAQASKWLFPKRDQAPVGLAVSGVPS